jgi:hypothetical protein
MTAILQAITAGYSADEIIKYLAQVDKKNGPKIKKALDAGYTPEEIVEFLSPDYAKSKTARTQGYRSFAQRQALPQGMTEQERQSMISQSQGMSFGDVGKAGLKAASMVAPLALGYGVARGAGPIAQVIGGYLANKAATPAAAPVSLPTTSSPTTSNGSLLKNIVTGVASLFGFRSKPLVNAIEAIVEKTGQTVQEVHDELAASSDVSTPEKATKAALERIKTLTGEGKTEKAEDIRERREGATEKLLGAKTLEQTKEDLAQSLKSSVIRKMNYKPDTNELDIIFNNDATYRYYDFPEEKFRELQSMGTPAKTSGENAYGIWWIGKNPSLGATFNKIIQPGKRKAGPYEYERVGETPMTDEEVEELESYGAPPAKEKAKSFLNRMNKMERLGSKISGERARTKEEITESISDYLVLADQLKSKTGTSRSEGAIEAINKRLSILKKLEDRAGKKRKATMIDDEAIRAEKNRGPEFIKKMIAILPKSIAQLAKEQIDQFSEKDVLKFILNYFKSKK